MSHLEAFQSKPNQTSAPTFFLQAKASRRGQEQFIKINFPKSVR